MRAVVNDVPVLVVNEEMREALNKPQGYSIPPTWTTDTKKGYACIIILAPTTGRTTETPKR